jgi:hypothetical protein
LARAPVSKTGGWGFESLLSCQCRRAVRSGDRRLRRRIEKAAKYYNVDLSETSWHDLGVHPQQNREEAAAKGVATERKREEEG